MKVRRKSEDLRPIDLFFWQALLKDFLGMTLALGEWWENRTTREEQFCVIFWISSTDGAREEDEAEAGSLL